MGKLWIDGLHARALVLFVIHVGEVVVLATARGGGGQVQRLAILGLENIAALRLFFRQDRLIVLHQVAAGVDVVVAGEHGIDIEFRQHRGELLAQVGDVLIKVMRALGVRAVVHANDDPVIIRAAGFDGLAQELLVAGDIGVGRSIGVQADEEHVIALEVVVADIVRLMRVGEVLIMMLHGEVISLVVARDRVGRDVTNLRGGEVCIVLRYLRTPTLNLVTQGPDHAGIRHVGGRVADGLAPLFGLVIHLEVHADLRVSDGQEGPVIAIGTGVEGLWLGPAAFFGAYAVGVLGIRLQVGSGGELGLVQQGAKVPLVGAEGLGAFWAGDLEDLVCLGLGAPGDHDLGFILARLQDGAVDGRISGQRWGGGHEGGSATHGEGGGEGGDEAR